MGTGANVMAWSPRELEDLVLPCASCGTYPTGTVLGARDWIESPDDLREAEVDALIGRARGTWVDEDEPGELGDEDTGNAEAPWVVDASRVDVSDDPLTCVACDAELPVTFRALAAAHGRLSPKDVRWIHNYVAMKEMIRFGLDHAGAALRGDLGMFINAHSPALRHREITVGARALPLFVPSQRLIELVDERLLGAQQFLDKLGSEDSCRVGDELLPLPSEYDGPEVVVDVELGIGIVEIAKAVQACGSTPLRGLGTLRTVEYDWGGDRGRLLYLEFDLRVRDELAERFG